MTPRQKEMYQILTDAYSRAEAECDVQEMDRLTERFIELEGFISREVSL